MPYWGFDPTSNRYRNRETGRYVSHNQVIDWAYAYADASGNAAAVLGSQVATGQLQVGDWQAAMRQTVKTQYINQYMAGRGGYAQMTQRDWGALGQMLRDQYGYLDGFAAEVAAGGLSEAQIQARARMYIDAAHEAFERGRAESFGMPTLPAYPGDGGTRCLSRCRCNWLIDPVTDGELLKGWDIKWRLEATAKHCEDCPENAKLWDPLFVPAGMTPDQAHAWREDQIKQMLSVRGG